MAKRGWMLVSLRKFSNIFVAISILGFAGACASGPEIFDGAKNKLIGKNIDYAVLGPGYYPHPKTGKIVYFNNPKARILRESNTEVTYQARINSCIYEHTVNKKTRLMTSWRFIHEDRRYCNLR